MPDDMWHSKKSFNLSFRHAFDDSTKSVNGNRVAGKEQNQKAPASKNEQSDYDEIASSAFHVSGTTLNN